MIPVSYTVPAETTAPLFAAAFAKGCGGEVSGLYQPTRPWAGFGSRETWEGLRATRKAGLTWYYGDHAYFGRKRFYRISRDAFQHSGIGESDGTRFRAFEIPIEPWSKRGSEILVCPPDHAWARLMSLDPHLWLADVTRKLRENSDRKIVVRKRGAATPLALQLRSSFAVVVHTSNVAVEAILAGVPAFCTADCAARSMSRSDPVNIEYPLRPDDRERWAGVLADNQWTLEEMASGLAWEKLR